MIQTLLSSFSSLLDWLWFGSEPYEQCLNPNQTQCLMFMFSQILKPKPQ